MARTQQGWSLYRTKHGTYHVRWRHGGTRFKVTTGERTRRAAQVEAARIYAEYTTEGRAPAPRGDLGDLMDAWLSSREAELAPETLGMYEAHGTNHLVPYFRTVDAITARSVDTYISHRLTLVKRKTVVKELSTLRQFVGYLERQGTIPRAPEVRSPAKRAIGTEASPRQHIPLSAEQVQSILAELPETTRRTGTGGGLPARAYFTVMWETALRFSTLNRIRAPFDYRKGSTTLRVRAEVDKARYARTLPLSPRAREALDSVVPEEGLIFGRHQYRHTLRQAALRAGFSEADARHIGYHEIRHAALMDLGASTTDLTAIAYIAGHKHIVTTAQYVRGREEGAADALAARAIGTSDRDQRTKRDGGQK
jgi:integrase